MKLLNLRWVIVCPGHRHLCLSSAIAALMLSSSSLLGLKMQCSTTRAQPPLALLLCLSALCYESRPTTHFASVWVCCPLALLLSASNFHFVSFSCAFMLALESAFQLYSSFFCGLIYMLALFLLSVYNLPFSYFFSLSRLASLKFFLLWVVIFIFPCNPWHKWNLGLRNKKLLHWNRSELSLCSMASN